MIFEESTAVAFAESAFSFHARLPFFLVLSFVPHEVIKYDPLSRVPVMCLYLYLSLCDVPKVKVAVRGKAFFVVCVLSSLAYTFCTPSLTRYMRDHNHNRIDLLIPSFFRKLSFWLISPLSLLFFSLSLSPLYTHCGLDICTRIRAL